MTAQFKETYFLSGEIMMWRLLWPPPLRNSFSPKLGGGFNYFLIFTPILGGNDPTLTCAYFSNGLVQPPTRSSLKKNMSLRDGTSNYGWWLKSCTTWDVWNPINIGKNYLSTGAGFQPSTVVADKRTVVIFFLHRRTLPHLSRICHWSFLGGFFYGFSWDGSYGMNFSPFFNNKFWRFLWTPQQLVHFVWTPPRVTARMSFFFWNHHGREVSLGGLVQHFGFHLDFGDPTSSMWWIELNRIGSGGSKPFPKQPKKYGTKFDEGVLLFPFGNWNVPQKTVVIYK